MVNGTFYLQNGRRHGYEGVTIQNPRTSVTTDNVIITDNVIAADNVITLITIM